MSNQTISITDSIYKYLCENSLREDENLFSLRAHTYRMEQRNMQISPEQGQFMQLLVKLMGAKKNNRGWCIYWIQFIKCCTCFTS